MPLRSRCLYFGFWLLGLVATLRGQSTWALVPSGTTHSLWGVCYGRGQFVAVGEYGTILTSPDGAQWTARASGVEVWLTAVTYAYEQYIAVGDHGTVLVSRDGSTWRNLAQGTSGVPDVRLNVAALVGNRLLMYGENDQVMTLYLPAQLGWYDTPQSVRHWWRAFAAGLDRYVVGGEQGLLTETAGNELLGVPESTFTDVRNVTGVIFDRNQFVAVGEAGAIVASSDAKTWTRETSPVSADFQALGGFNNTLVAVGGGGTIVSRDEHGAWVQRTSPTSQVLTGIAAADPTAVIVGQAGTILRGTADAVAPLITVQPTSASETQGGAVTFMVRANGSLPLAYQWYRDGVALAGQTGDTLVRAPLAAADAGTYTVAVSNAAGRHVSAPVNLVVTAALAAVVDPTFRADPSLTGSPSALLAQPDRGILVADGRPGEVVRLRPDGSVDPAWDSGAVGRLTAPLVPMVTAMARQSDGRIVVIAMANVPSGPPVNYVVRLQTDGRIDTGFTVAPEATAGVPNSLAVQSDDRIVLSNGARAPVRLQRDGALDQDFTPEPLETTTSDRWNLPRDWAIQKVALAADGRIYIAAIANISVSPAQYPHWRTTVLRLHDDGSIDPTFTRFSTDGWLSGMGALADGGVLVTTIGLVSWGAINPTTKMYRLTRDGDSDPGYTTAERNVAGAPLVQADGSVVYADSARDELVFTTGDGQQSDALFGGVGHLRLIAAGPRCVYVSTTTGVYDGIPAGAVARVNFADRGTVAPPRVLGLTTDKRIVRAGERVTVRALVSGSGNLTYEWDGAPTTPAVVTSVPAVTFAFTSPGDAGLVRLTVRNRAGVATSFALAFTIMPDAPTVTQQPFRLFGQSGRDLVFDPRGNAGSGVLAVEWRKDGQPLNRAEVEMNGLWLRLHHVTPADAGTYVATARNSLGEETTSQPIVVTIDDTSRLVNVSTRAFVGPGEQTLIAGFTAGGQMSRTFAIRGVGPSLAKLGVSGVLADPVLRVYDGQGQLAWTCPDDWGVYNDEPYIAQAFADVGAFPLESGSKDAAGIAALSRGSYTAQLTAKPGDAGIALLEVYEHDLDAERMLNLSSRAYVDNGAPAVAGFAIRGAVPKKVLLRAVGPALRALGVAQVLADPRLTVRDAGGALVAVNDDWEKNANVAEVMRVSAAAGAFPLSAGSKDAVALVTLAPGNYTAVVEGAAGQSGVALVEVYDADLL